MIQHPFLRVLGFDLETIIVSTSFNPLNAFLFGALGLLQG